MAWKGKINIIPSDKLVTKCVVQCENDNSFHVFDRFVAVGVEEDGKLLCVTATDLTNIGRTIKVLQKIYEEGMNQVPDGEAINTQANLILETVGDELELDEL
jgi:hypothetical protein